MLEPGKVYTEEELKSQLEEFSYWLMLSLSLKGHMVKLGPEEDVVAKEAVESWLEKSLADKSAEIKQRYKIR